MSVGTKKPVSRYKHPDESGKNRYERALALYNAGAVRQVSAYEYEVVSKSNTYLVTEHEDGTFTCDCPEGKPQNHDCKHVLAVKLYLGIEIDLTPQINWTAYNQSQCHELEMVKLFLHDLATIIPNKEPSAKGGRPSIPLGEQFFSAVMKVYCKSSSRRAHGYTMEYANSQLISKLPSFNQVNKFLENENVTPILHHLVRISALPMAEIETKFSVDSSGFETSKFSTWCDNKHGKKYTSVKGEVIKAKRKREWVKCHIMSGNLTNVITDVVITHSEGKGSADEANFEALVRNTSMFFNVDEVFADAIYSVKDNFRVAKEVNAIPFIMFKKSNIPQGIWYDVFSKLFANKDAYLGHLTDRNNVESTFSAVKRKMGERLLSRTYRAQVNELLCKIIAYNITLLAGLYFNKGKAPEWSGLSSAVV